MNDNENTEQNDNQEERVIDCYPTGVNSADIPHWRVFTLPDDPNMYKFYFCDTDEIRQFLGTFRTLQKALHETSDIQGTNYTHEEKRFVIDGLMRMEISKYVNQFGIIRMSDYDFARYCDVLRFIGDEVPIMPPRQEIMMSKAEIRGCMFRWTGSLETPLSWGWEIGLEEEENEEEPLCILYRML